MTRDEHLSRCKERALKYCDLGDLPSAFASMAQDLAEHPETKNHAAIDLGFRLLFNGHLSTAVEMRKFIEGFH